MMSVKKLVAPLLAILVLAARGGAQERIALDQSSERTQLHGPDQEAAPAAERFGRSARSGERYLDFILDNQSNHSDWILSAFMDADTKIEILEIDEARPGAKTIFSRTLPIRKEASLGGPFAVRLEVPQKSSRHYLIFLSDAHPVKLTLWSGDAYIANSVRRHLFLGLFYGAALLLVLSQLTASFALKDSSFSWFGLFILFSSVSLSYWDGIAIETFHPPWLPASEGLFYFGFANLSMAFGYLFLHRFADLRAAAPRLGRLVLAMAAFQAALTVIVPLTRPAFFPLMVAVLGTAHASIQIIGGILAARRAVPSARLLVAGFSLQVAAAILLFLRALGLSLLERIEFALTLFYPSILASAVFIAAALLGRIRALGLARDLAETRSNALGAYFSDLYRELKVPMRLLMASIAAHERRSSPSRELSSLRKNADKLARSMDRLLEEPRPEGPAPPTRAGESTDLGAVLRERMSAFSAAAPEDGGDPLIEIEPRPLVDMDEAAAERVVDQVLGSVIGARAWNGDTRISVRRVRGRIELRAEVAAGDGLDAFASPLVEGPGAAEDAFIERSAMPSGGASFRASLPAASAGSAKAGSAKAPPAPAKAGPDRPEGSLPWARAAQPRGSPREAGPAADAESRPRVLIASDESALAARLAARLGVDFRTMTAEDAGTALDILAAEGEYAVVIVDLPGGIAEGHEILRLARADSRRAGTAFIIAAGADERGGRREVLAEGSVVLLARPVDVEEAASAAADLSRRYAEGRRRQEDEYRRRLELMLGGLSHAIKNPLSGITGPLACMRRIPSRELPPEAEKYLGQMEESAARIGTILRDVGAALFSRPLRSGAIDLDVLLGGVADIVRTAHPGLVVVRDHAGGIAIRGDPEAARTIFENVLANAAEAMEGSGEIRVTVAPTPARVEIEIRDRGPGIPQADLERIFDPFFSTKGMGRGMGLGLAIVRGLADDMSWEVAVGSKAGEGTSFRISAPRFRPERSAS
jgi:signal transduction histidine kinase